MHLGDMRKLDKDNEIKEMLVKRFIESRERKKMIPQIITLMFILLSIITLGYRFFFVVDKKHKVNK